MLRDGSCHIPSCIREYIKDSPVSDWAWVQVTADSWIVKECVDLLKNPDRLREIDTANPSAANGLGEMPCRLCANQATGTGGTAAS